MAQASGHALQGSPTEATFESPLGNGGGVAPSAVPQLTAAGGGGGGSGTTGSRWSTMLSRAKVSASRARHTDTSEEFQALRDALKGTRSCVGELEREATAYRAAATAFAEASARYAAVLARVAAEKQLDAVVAGS